MPLGKQEGEDGQISFYGLIPGFEEMKEEHEAPYCKIYNWRSDKSIIFKGLGEKSMGKKLFDYVIGNPPYQEDTAGAGRQATPVYNLFVEEAKKITNKSVSLITPSRWFSGGMGLDNFRNMMLKDKHIKAIIDYTNAKDIFPNTSISGGVNYFIWVKEYQGSCIFTNTTNGETTTKVRDLDEFPVLVRYNHAVDIIHKIKKEASENLTVITSGLMPFGLSTNYRGKKERSNIDN